MTENQKQLVISNCKKEQINSTVGLLGKLLEQVALRNKKLIASVPQKYVSSHAKKLLLSKKTNMMHRQIKTELQCKIATDLS